MWAPGQKRRQAEQRAHEAEQRARTAEARVMELEGERNAAIPADAKHRAADGGLEQNPFAGGPVAFGKRIGKRIGADHVSSYAAALTYHGLFALFPFALFLLTLLDLFGAPNTLQHAVVKSPLPADAKQLIITNVLSQHSGHGTAILSAVFALAFSLWGISGMFRSLMEALNVVAQIQDRRPFWLKYAISILGSVLIATLLLVALTLLVSGGAIADAIARHAGGLGSGFTVTWKIIQWPVLIALVLVAFAIVYRLGPDTHQPLRILTIGSATATVLWLAFSLLFSLYVNNFSSYDATYGTLAGLVVMLLYMYYSSFLLLLGAELDALIRPPRQDQPLKDAAKAKADAEPT